MKILSLDQSTLKTGVSVFKDKKLQNHFLIDLSKEKKSRDWLFSQSDLKKQVYELLKGENHA